MITVVAAPPYATVQDLGRDGYRASGIPPSGVADRHTALALNDTLGNEPNAAMLEWAIAGGALRFDLDATISLGGADADAFANGVAVRSYVAVQMHAGQELRVDRLVRGRFLYIAFAGGIDVPVLLGSRSTLVSAGLGGHEGRRLRTGDVLRIGSTDPHQRALATAQNPANGLRDTPAAGEPELIQIVPAPQGDMFSPEAWSTFTSRTYVVSRTSDRVGYRLDGPPLAHSGAAALPSEPTCLGAIQVPIAGTPIVLMQDGPTVGGYPKIAVVRSAALSRFAQQAPGATVRFVLQD